MAFTPSDALFTPSRYCLRGDSLVKTYLRNSRIDKFDTFIILLVVAVTVCTNLLYAVVAGMALTSLRFAWQSQEPLEVVAMNSNVSKVYEIRGNLFFASKE